MKTPRPCPSNRKWTNKIEFDVATACVSLLNDTVRFYSITETTRTKQETITTQQGCHRWHKAPSTLTRPNVAASQPTRHMRRGGPRPSGMSYTLATAADQGKNGHRRDHGVKTRRSKSSNTVNKSLFWHHDATCCLLHHRPHERTRGPPTVHEPRPRSSVLVREVVGPRDGVQK